MEVGARWVRRTGGTPLGSGGGGQVLLWKPSRMSRLSAAWSLIMMSRVVSILRFHAAVNSSTIGRDRMYTRPCLGLGLG